MWPWGHLAVGYVCFVVLCRQTELEQSAPTLLLLAVGTQFPDLVDKPLAWTIGVLPSGRSLAHSLLVIGLLLGILRRLVPDDDRALVTAFGIGAISHALSDLGPDVVIGLLQGNLNQLQWTTFLVWPLLPSPPYPHDDSFIQHFAAFALDPYVLFQVGLVGVAVGIWVGSGMPGYAAVRERLRKPVS